MCSGDDTAHEKFVEVSDAYDVLSDAETRKIYDRYGHDGVQNHRQGGGGGHHDPFDLFSRFFGGHGHSGRHSAEPRGQNREFRIELPLRDFYNGVNTQFEWEKQHICEKCEGSGSADGKVETCSTCGGHGVRIMKQQLAPGFVQQVQMRCDACGGKGNTIKNKCPACKGHKVERKATPVDLKIERGIAEGARVVYENEADESPDWIAGDLVVHLAQSDPTMQDNPDRVDGAFFRRKGDDLYWTEVLSLREAWMGGWSRNLTHLDNHTVRLGREAGTVIQPGHVETVEGEGMPKWHEDGDSVYHKFEFGNLYVSYEVILPDQMDADMHQEFRGVWDKWMGKQGVDLHKDSGRPDPGPERVRDEL